MLAATDDAHVVVLFGAMGDLARRKLLPGLLHLFLAGMITDVRIVGASLEDVDDAAFVEHTRLAVAEFSTRPMTDEQWATFTGFLRYVPGSGGAAALRAAVTAADGELGGTPRRLHHLSVPPKAALAVVALLDQAGPLGAHGPDHLTFDQADSSKMSLSFYGKRPGPGMKLDKLSMQFATKETSWAGSVLEAYERLIHDAIRGDHTLFTSAEGIERLWEVSTPLLDNPPPVRPYPPGSWGPNAIHQLVAPGAWRLPFERTWRDPNPLGS